jgi:hypothetical protein
VLSVVFPKRRIIRCKSRSEVTSDDKLMWVYTQKEFIGTVSEYYVDVFEHRVPFWSSLHMHLTFERMLEYWVRVISPFVCRGSLLPYDLVYGFVCGFGMKEIVSFWRSR